MFHEYELTPDTLIYGLFLGAMYKILVGEDKLGGIECLNENEYNNANRKCTL